MDEAQFPELMRCGPDFRDLDQTNALLALTQGATVVSSETDQRGQPETPAAAA
jgi:hypothetical protein